jgi:O-antigen/teichoic acid export membrane protein
MTVVLLVNPLLMAVGNLLEPKAARAIVERGPEHLRRIIWRLSLALSALMAVYFVALLFAGGWLVSVIYAGNEYIGRGHLVAVLAATVLASAIDTPVAHGLRAMDRPDLNFRAAAVALLVTALAGVVLVPRYGMLLGAYSLLFGILGGMVTRLTLFLQLSLRPCIPLRGLYAVVEAEPSR